MLKHIVMWKLKDFAEGEDRAANAQRLKLRLEGLKGRIEGLLGIEVGININKSDAAYDVVLYSEFESLEALEHYQKHPEHVEIAEFVAGIRESRVVADYQAD